MNGAETAFGGVRTELNSFEIIRKKSILVVDDDAGVVESLEETFNDDFNVFTAKDGKEAIDLLQRHRVDFVTLDLTMPGMDGMDVLKWIRGLSKPPHVIVITAHSDHERAKFCADSAAVVGYIEKPFDCLELLERVKVILGVNKNEENAVTNSELVFANKPSGLIEKVVRYSDTHCTNINPPIRPKDVAKEFGIPRKRLGKMFKEETGYSMDYYINWKRVQEAKGLLLRDWDAHLSEILPKSGFENMAHFLRVFKRYTSTTPTEFRESNSPFSSRSHGEA